VFLLFSDVESESFFGPAACIGQSMHESVMNAFTIHSIWAKVKKKVRGNVEKQQTKKVVKFLRILFYFFAVFAF
jgi:hypothetical protein